MFCSKHFVSPSACWLTDRKVVKPCKSLERIFLIVPCSQERKWGAAVGWVGAALTVAGGGDYGDETVDTLRGHVWDRNHEVDIIR